MRDNFPLGRVMGVTCLESWMIDFPLNLLGDSGGFIFIVGGDLVWPAQIEYDQVKSVV